MSCRLAGSLYRWVDTVLQPAAREMLGSPLTRISGETYSCRNMYHNRHLPLSEHAKANAIDIASFVTTDGRTITVKLDWGPTERDVADAQRKAAAANERMEKISGTASATGDAERKARERERGQLLKAVLKSEAVLRKSEATSEESETAFLRRAHRGACGLLKTVLGPEANDAHLDHFHLDMKERDGTICH